MANWLQKFIYLSSNAVPLLVIIAIIWQIQLKTWTVPIVLPWIIHLGIGDMKSHLAGLKATFGALRILTERRSW